MNHETWSERLARRRRLHAIVAAWSEDEAERRLASLLWDVGVSPTGWREYGPRPVSPYWILDEDPAAPAARAALWLAQHPGLGWLVRVPGPPDDDGTRTTFHWTAHPERPRAVHTLLVVLMGGGAQIPVTPQRRLLAPPLSGRAPGRLVLDVTEAPWLAVPCPSCAPSGGSPRGHICLPCGDFVCCASCLGTRIAGGAALPLDARAAVERAWAGGEATGRPPRAEGDGNEIGIPRTRRTP